MTEHPCITFVPDGPRGEQCEGGHRLPVGDGVVGERGPPPLGGFKVLPAGGINVFKLQPHLDHVPDPDGKPTSEEKVIDRFLLTPTERAKATVWPSTFGQSVSGPHYFGRPAKRRTSLWEGPKLSK